MTDPASPPPQPAEPSPPRRVLPLIVIAQFLGTSLWFAGNAVGRELGPAFGLDADSVGSLTASVQLGFIAGTLIFAFLNVADRFSPRAVFFACAIAGAGMNLAIVVLPREVAFLLGARFLTGVSLAGVYPVGMKIAASWFDRGLGNALGLLVGALVLGTAFPHLLESLGGGHDWRLVLVTTSALAATGGGLVLFLVPEGPALPHRSGFDPRALVGAFASPDFRASAFAYFGHMWEIYTFWTFLPAWIAARGLRSPGAELDVSWWSFVVIASGFIGCSLGGIASRRFGSSRVAAVQLATSAALALTSPWWMREAPTSLFLAMLIVHGITAAGDSPQFSALNARTAPRAYVGSALTAATSIGFGITIPSLWALSKWKDMVDIEYLLVPLAIGPALGLIALRPLLARVRG
jgi:predicted MFS family arabinose efflux permease